MGVGIVLKIKRGDIFYANLNPSVGSEQSGVRPILIVQNDIGNKYSPTVIAVAITSKTKAMLPTHIPIKKEESNLPHDSIILTEQIRTIDKSRLIKKVGELNLTVMEKVKEALKISFSIRADFSEIFEDW